MNRLDRMTSYVTTGNLWDKFPSLGHHMLPGLKPVNDMQT